MADSALTAVRDAVRASIAAKEAFLAEQGEVFVAAAHDTARALAAGGNLLLCGNGGSAADAQHVASELVNRLSRDRRPIGAIALTTDSSALTSIANDASYEQVFARQVEAIGRPGDVLLGISTSGNSANVLAAFAVAERAGMLTVGFLGCDGGKCRHNCRHPVIVPERSTQRIQEVHILMGHLFAELIEDQLHPETGR